MPFVHTVATADLGAPVVELAGVHVNYGKTVALNGIDIRVKRGELFALLGPNGAGKSTAISVMLGLQDPTSGKATLFGAAPGSTAARRNVGVMMQEVTLCATLRVREHVDLVASYYPNAMKVEDALALSGTTAIGDKQYAQLSGGQKRQAQFAMAIAGRPKLLFLDEPTVGLDVQARESMWAAIRALLADGCSIVLTTHYLEEAEALADTVAVLVNGRIVSLGTVNEMRALVTRKRVSCETKLTADQVMSWRDVEIVARDQSRLVLTVTDAERVVQQLFAADPHLKELEVTRAGLAEAFAALTKEAA